jgi:gamma-glutamylputrescine oxidase
MTAANYYTIGASTLQRAALRGATEARVCIIGGGFAGLHCALSLLERGERSVVLLEAEHVGFGASGRNGGFVFAGYSLGESALLKRLGTERARYWYAQTQAAVVRIRELIARYRIECDCVDAGVLWVNWFADQTPLIARQALLAEHFATQWQHVERATLRELIQSDRYSGALFERNAMHVNPLRLAQGLAAACEQHGGHIYEASPAIDLRQNGRTWQIRTPDGVVNAEHVIVAGGGYLHGAAPPLQTLRRALLPIATYVLASKPLGALADQLINTQAAIYDTRFAFDYYRKTLDKRIVWGGRISILQRTPETIAKLLSADMQRVFPALQTGAQKDSLLSKSTMPAGTLSDYAWSGLMSYARHEMPQIGTLQPGLWYAQAFGGHGLAPTCVAGETLADAILSDDTRYVELAEFGLSPTFGALGMLAAQWQYSWLQWRDAWHERRSARTASA